MQSKLGATTSDCKNVRWDARLKIWGSQGYEAHDLHGVWDLSEAGVQDNLDQILGPG